MRKNTMSDFIVESKDHCFFCLNKTSPLQTNLGDDELRTELTTVHSLQYFSRYLRMVMKKVFIEEGDTPLHLLAKVEMSRLKAHLCQRCANLNEVFSKLCRSLEQIEMEVMSSLQQIYEGLLKSEGTTAYQKLLDQVEDSGEQWTGKLGILDVLRKEAIQKCSYKLQTSTPRIKLQKMSKRGLTKIMQKYTLISGRKKKKPVGNRSADLINSHIDIPGIKMEHDETLADQYFDDPDVDHQSDSEIGSDNPTPPPNWIEQVVVKREHNEPTSSRKSGSPRPKQRGMLDPKINKHLERIKSKGRMKFRCKLCGKGFSQSKNAPRHIRAVHLKEKSHRCPQCSKAFSQKEHLQAHMLIHSGIRPFKCNVCPKEFFQSALLKRHLVVHGGKRPHKCDICGAAYFHRRDMERHSRLAHGRHCNHTS